MGREAIAQCSWAGQSGEAKILLESQEIILRGGIKARIPRSAISLIAAVEECLHVTAPGGELVAQLGAKEAARWAEALARPAPSLAAKLGIGGGKPAFLLGETNDEALLDALAGHHRVEHAEQASVIIALIDGETDLDAAVKLAAEQGLMLWCVYPKGKGVCFGDMAIRSYLRGAGWMDNKTCAVSDRLTATRYGRK